MLDGHPFHPQKHNIFAQALLWGVDPVTLGPLLLLSHEGPKFFGPGRLCRRCFSSDSTIFLVGFYIYDGYFWALYNLYTSLYIYPLAI